MSVIERGLDTIAILSDHFQEILRRRLRECCGLALMALAFVGAVALATWSVQDPSLSHATNAPIRNLVGAPGAIAADLMMQLLGLAAVVLVLLIAILGWRLLTHRPLYRERLRMLFWIVTTLLAAAFLSCLPKTASWPLPKGLGGVVGDALLRVPAFLLGPLSGTNRIAFASVTGILALAIFTVAAGMIWRDPLAKIAAARDYQRDDDPDEEERASISLGRLVHGLLSLKARLRRLFTFKWHARPASPAISAYAGTDSRGRLEPRFGDFDGMGAESGDEDEEEETEAAPRRAARKPARVAPRRSSGGYVLPALGLLTAPKSSERSTLSSETIEENGRALESVLGDFGVRGEIINARPGPVVTLYELEPAPGIKSSRVIGLSDDIARSMSKLSARVAVVPGRNAIGIELPNPTREKVYLRELLDDDDYSDNTAKLPLCLGKTIGGESVIVDLARMPHLLIAGTTGSGKSVAINTMILSLVYRLRPDQCRLIMVDPKMLELSVYDGIPHLLTPVVTDPKKAVVALKWAVREMEERYKKMSKLGVRNIDGYNARVVEAKGKGETLTRTVHTGYDKESGEAIYEKEELELDSLPYLVVIVDEMADLMMVAGKDIEGAIQRLAQMARAAGIHVILATQRPSVDVITGTIKANFPTRISFQVTSKIDSRTILGEQGAEQLLGQGDMLYMAGGGRISRVHGPFVSDEEVEKVVRHLKSQGVPQYLEAVTAEDELGEDGNPIFDATGMGAGDATDLYQQAVQVVTRDRKASTSYIQRRLQIGYNRAASLMERMEHEGVVGQPNHAGKREILVGEDGNAY
ncbi:MAG: segregation ATPase FtsK/SpoIIIE, family [Alphaproteobacteria bacterium]|jgi:S-DNA-T family DNA segregation ATPase FtsK/SpoIIIE|nr:segregation ATPase FtsK/SpoIIIE, family [Alphaproteobacteria bacterium]